MKHEKICKRCNVPFVGFTPVCKECNLKGPDKEAVKNESDNATPKTEQPSVPNMPGALSAVPRRSQKNQHEANEPSHHTSGSSFPQQKNIFNNNNYNNHNNHHHHNNNNHNNNNEQNDYYSNSGAFGNGFNRKKKPQEGNAGSNTTGGNHGNNNYHSAHSDRVPDAFARIGKHHNNQRHQGQSHRPGGYNHANDSNGHTEGNSAPRAFDFRNNRHHNNHQHHVNHHQDGNFGDRMANVTEQTDERESKNPFVHLQKVCESHKEGKCVYGDRCRFLHSSSTPNSGKSVKADRSNISKEGFGVRL